MPQKAKARRISSRVKPRSHKHRSPVCSQAMGRKIPLAIAACQAASVSGKIEEFGFIGWRKNSLERSSNHPSKISKQLIPKHHLVQSLRNLDIELLL
jgi:hypothetical protein